MAQGTDIEELRRGGVVKLKEKDVFSMWVKTSCCNLNSRQMRKLADIVDKYARGMFLFTTRQIPIIPFVHIDNVIAVKHALAEVEMELDRCGNRVRNVNVCYDSKLCAVAATNSITLGEKLETFFASPLLRKVKIGVAGCRKDCIMSRLLNDVSFLGVENGGRTGYDVYVGGRLGVSPAVGPKMAECLSEEQCVRLLHNYMELMASEAKPSERGADLNTRLGAEAVKKTVTKDLNTDGPVPIVKCKHNVKEKQPGKTILKIRATCGEVTSNQARAIADIAEQYGTGFIHFATYGDPQLPGINKQDLPEIRKKLHEVDLHELDRGVGNIQACFGNYCAEGLADSQSLLRDVEKKVAEVGLDNLDIRISAAGCPNSCGIAQASDIGFHGVSEPQIDAKLCSGCGLCPQVCKRHAITLVNELAVINKKECRYCGQCMAICPSDAITSQRSGFKMLVGGAGGENARLGQAIGEFLTAAEALRLTEATLKIIKERKANVSTITDEIGFDKVKQMIVNGAK